MYDTLRLLDVLSFTHVWNLDVTSGIVPVHGSDFGYRFVVRTGTQ